MARYDANGDRTEQFLRRFQRNLLEHVARHGSISESFGAVWEKTLEAVPLDERGQGQLYRELIGWAKGPETKVTKRHSCILQCVSRGAPDSRQHIDDDSR
jgi:hypothetical protein